MMKPIIRVDASQPAASKMLQSDFHSFDPTIRLPELADHGWPRRYPARGHGVMLWQREPAVINTCC